MNRQSGSDDGRHGGERARREESAIRRLLAAIGEIAAEGGWADRGALCRRSGITDNAIGAVLAAVEARGLVEIRWDRGSGSRCIRVVATGATTAGFAEASRTKPRRSRPGYREAPDGQKALDAARARGVKRKCMACEAEFVSTGPGHRLCKDHRGGDGGLDVHRIAPSR